MAGLYDVAKSSDDGLKTKVRTPIAYHKKRHTVLPVMHKPKLRRFSNIDIDPSSKSPITPFKRNMTFHNIDYSKNKIQKFDEEPPLQK